ncbi:MAG: hypothetical protein KU37_10775 [Sulfuricurvum sp. PC08-66]|nr:MAG: hypothetical protein KU37_10775 [Sulfuricurvum sp. PC08-66]
MKSVKVLRALVVASLLASSAMAEDVVASVKDAIMPAKTAYAGAMVSFGFIGVGAQAMYGDQLFPVEKFANGLPGNIGWEVDAHIETAGLGANANLTYTYKIEAAAVKGLEVMGAFGLGYNQYTLFNTPWPYFYNYKAQAKYMLDNGMKVVVGYGYQGFVAGIQITM